MAAPIPHPSSITPVDHTAPVPRRVRAVLAGETVIDTTHAMYVWEHPYYPSFYIPAVDVRTEHLDDEKKTVQARQGTLAVQSLVVGDERRPDAARLVTDSPIDGLLMTYRFDWAAFDSWFEEDEEIFVHPRSPYVRVDALISSRTVRVDLDGKVLAESSAPVMLFETGLPTRFYLEKTSVDWSTLEPSATVTECPYKGMTSRYWHAMTDHGPVEDIAWSYDFPTRDVLPIAGRVAFYNDKVDIMVDGVELERPGPMPRPDRSGDETT